MNTPPLDYLSPENLLELERIRRKAQRYIQSNPPQGPAIFNPVEPLELEAMEPKQPPLSALHNVLRSTGS